MFIQKKIFYFYFFLFFCVVVFIILNSPIDYRQGPYVRIMHIHVPSAWISMFAYLYAGFCSFLFIAKNEIKYFFHTGSALLGGYLFTILTILTGSIWGRNIWLTWWIWDARTISFFILCLFYTTNIVFFLYLKKTNFKRIFCFFFISSLSILPLVHFSAIYFETLHQGSSIERFFREGSKTVSFAYVMNTFLVFIFNIHVFIISFIRYNRFFLYENECKTKDLSFDDVITSSTQKKFEKEKI